MKTLRQQHLSTLTPTLTLRLPRKRPRHLPRIVTLSHLGVARDLAVLHPQAMEAIVAHHPAAGLPSQGGHLMHRFRRLTQPTYLVCLASAFAPKSVISTRNSAGLGELKRSPSYTIRGPTGPEGSALSKWPRWKMRGDALRSSTVLT